MGDFLESGSRFSCAFLKDAALALATAKLPQSKRDRLEDYMMQIVDGEVNLTYYLSVEDFLKRRW